MTLLLDQPNAKNQYSNKIHVEGSSFFDEQLSPSGKDHNSFVVNFKTIQNEIKRLFYPTKFALPFVPAEIYQLGNSNTYLVLSPHKQAAYINLNEPTDSPTIIDYSKFCDNDVKNMVVYNNEEVFVADYYFVIYQINLNTLACKRRYKIHSHAVLEIIVSRNSEFFYTVSSDHSLLKTSVETKMSKRLWQLPEMPSCMGMSPDESFCVIGVLTNTLHVFSLEDNAVLYTLQTENEPTCIKVSNENRIFCANKGVINMWDHGSKSLIKVFNGEPNYYTYISLNPANTLIAASCSDGSVHIWNILHISLDPIKSVSVGKLIHKVFFISDDQVYYFSNDISRLMIWRIPLVFSESSINLATSKTVKKIFYCETNQYIVANIENDGCEIWNLNTNEKIKHLYQGRDGTLAMSENQNDIVGLYNAKRQYHMDIFTLNLSNFKMESEGFVNYGDRWWVTEVVCNRNRRNNCITLACANGKVDIREDFGFESVKSDWPLTDNIITCMGSSYSGIFLLIGDSEGIVRSFNLNLYTNEGNIVKHDSPISAIDVSNDDSILASGDDHGLIKISHIPTQTTMNTIKFHTLKITNLYIAASKIHLLAASLDNQLSIWDLRSQTLCVLKPDYYNFSVSEDESKIVIVGGATWKIISNPLMGSTISAFGPRSEATGYYRYLYDIMKHRNPVYDPAYNNWIISSNLYTTLHFYAYFHLSNHLKKALADKAYFVQTVDGMSPLNICLEYRSLVVNDLIKYLLERMQKNHGFSFFFRENLPKINEFGSEYIGELYGSLFAEVTNSRLPDFCGKSVSLPVIREIEDPLTIKKDDFLPVEIQGEIPQPVVYMQLLIPLCLTTGSEDSLMFLQSLLTCSNTEIFRDEFIRLLLDYKWKKVRWFMRILAATYYLYLALFTVYISTFLNPTAWIFLFILSTLLSFYEVFQMVSSPILYFLDLMNYIDLLRGALFYTYTYYVLNSIEDEISQGILIALAVVSFIRGITYFGIFSATRYMIFLIFEVWKDMISFIILLFYSITAITVIFLSIDYEQTNGTFYEHLLSSYRLGLGDLDTSGNSPVENIIFAGGSLINTIIMLNLLISIMGDTFDRVQQGTIEADRKTLTEFILELELLVFWKRKRQAKKYFFICKVDDVDAESSGNSWEGKIRIIIDKLDRNKKLIDAGNRAIHSGIKKVAKEMNQRFELELAKLKEEILKTK